MLGAVPREEPADAAAPREPEREAANEELTDGKAGAALRLAGWAYLEDDAVGVAARDEVTPDRAREGIEEEEAATVWAVRRGTEVPED